MERDPRQAPTQPQALPVESGRLAADMAEPAWPVRPAVPACTNSEPCAGHAFEPATARAPSLQPVPASAKQRWSEKPKPLGRRRCSPVFLPVSGEFFSQLLELARVHHLGLDHPGQQLLHRAVAEPLHQMAQSTRHQVLPPGCRAVDVGAATTPVADQPFLLQAPQHGANGGIAELADRGERLTTLLGARLTGLPEVVHDELFELAKQTWGASLCWQGRLPLRLVTLQEGFCQGCRGDSSEAGPAGVAVKSPAWARMTISTRRFLARPSGVAFEATG